MGKIKYYLILLVSLVACKANYLGNYQYELNNSTYYKSNIEIKDDTLVYNANVEMLGSISQKVFYLKKGNSLFVDFKKKDTIMKNIFKSNLESNLDSLRIKIVTIIQKDTIFPYVKVIINDSLNFIPISNITILKKNKIRKIEIKDLGFKYIKDTLLYFSDINKSNNFEFYFYSKRELPVLFEKGKIKFKIFCKKLYLFDYEEITNKYIKNKRVYVKD